MVQIAHDQLIHHHAERVDIRLLARRFSFVQLGREVHRRAAGGRRLAGHQRLCKSRRRDTQVFQSIRVCQQPDAEIGQDRLGRPTSLFHQDVSRFDVLVQHARGVGRGQCRGHLRHDAQACIQRNVRENALLVGPVFQVARFRVLRFDKIRRLLQFPVENAGDIVPVAQRFLQ